MEVTTDTGIKKPKRLTSVVWNHYERVRKGDICYAICAHCNKRLSGSSNSGTTHLRNHLMRCLKRSNYDVSQLLSVKRRKKEGTVSVASMSYDEGQIKEDFAKPLGIKFEHELKPEEAINIGSSKFDQDKSRLDLARMIISHGYPLSMVEHVGFKVFVKNLQPMFEFTSNDAIELSCMEVYSKEKQKVQDGLNKLQGRINIAVEKWSSAENTQYLSLTARYIDTDWRLHRKNLNFITLDCSHTKDMLPEVIVNSLVDWDIESKLFAITFDDFSVDDEIIVKIKERISENRPLLSNGQLFDLRSATHVLDDIAQLAVGESQQVIQRIRGSIKYIRSSQAVLSNFNEFAQQSGVNTLKSLLLDSPTRWNSTYIMLEAALEYKAAFYMLQEHDSAYSSTLSDIDWDRAISITGYLKVLLEIINLFLNNKNATANIYFPEICHLHIQMIEWCRNPDEFIRSIALKMKSKFDEHWSKCKLSLAFAVILDPRFKMKLVDYYYGQIYGSTVQERTKEVEVGIRELYTAYSICSSLVDDEGSALPASSLPNTTASDSKDRLKGFDKYLYENSQTQNSSSDLDKYLEEPVFPRNCDFNILNWWKVHTPRYPILSMMARDVLGTPMANIAPESTFTCMGRTLDHSLSSISPDIRQALICTRDWLQVESEGSCATDESDVYIVF